MIKATLMSSCHWKNPCTFLLAKGKRPEKALLKLTMNYRKIAQKKTNYAIQNNSKLAI